MTCCFLGHRLLYCDISSRLYDYIEYLIKIGYTKFLMTTHGDFSNLALSQCKFLKKKYNNIEIIVVITSLSNLKKDKNGFSNLNNYNDVQTKFYEIENIYFKQQIIESNKNMVEESDLVVSYFNPKIIKSGAKLAINYAKKLNKPIINLFKPSDNNFFSLSPEEKTEFIANFIKK